MEQLCNGLCYVGIDIEQMFVLDCGDELVYVFVQLVDDEGIEGQVFGYEVVEGIGWYQQDL